MTATKPTVITLAAIIMTFVLTESWHGAIDLIQARAALSRIDHPRIFEVTKAEIADLHRKGHMYLDREGNVLAIKQESK